MELYNDDCFEILPEIKDGSVDLVVVDLPYTTKGQKATACAWDTPIDLERMWKELKRCCKRDCVYVFFCTTKFGYKLIQSNERWFRYDIVWEKSRKVGFLSANKMPLRKHELVYIFKEKQGTYNPQKTEGHKPRDRSKNKKTDIKIIYGTVDTKKGNNTDGTRHPTSIVKFNNPIKSLHRTQKPVALCEWLIKSYSNQGDLVLDFTMGSGTTGVACKNTNRKFIGIERDEEIFKTACERLNETLD